MVKKLMQEAKRVKAYESLKQCPICGDPHGLVIELKVDRKTEKKSAYVRCHACHFEYSLPDIPAIADEFWVYSRVLDSVGSYRVKAREATAANEPSVSETESAEESGGEEEEVEVEVSEEA